MNLPFRTRLRNGEVLIGPMITLSCPEVAEIMVEVGYDWLFIDAEHSPHSPGGMQAILQAAGSTMPCLIRLPAGDELSIKKALDIGAAGIIVPQVNSAAQAERVVQMAKYAPLGTRGVGLGRASRYGLKFEPYLQTANDELVIVVQAEHVNAVRDIANIARVPGVDAVLVGPYDLSASMGLAGRVGDPQVKAAIRQVTQACLEAGVRLGIFGVSAEAVKPYLAQGYSLIVAGVDSLLMGHAAAALLAELKP